MHKYRLISKKGEGTFSEVLKAQSIKSGKYVAIKCMKNHFDSIDQVNNLREIQALRRLAGHPNIIKLQEVLYDEPTGRLALVFELMDMNLYEAIKGRRHYLQEVKIKQYMYEMLKALDHMHRNGIFHRDVKPENLLLLDDEIKLADLGSCRGIYSRQPYTEYISTRWYRAPECLLTDGFYNFKMDIFAAGCVWFEIVALFPLFPGQNEMDQIQKIHNVLGTPDPEFLTRKFKRNASHMDFNFPEKRGSGIERLIPHADPDLVELMKKLIKYDPDERILARQALKDAYFKEMRDAEKERQANSAPPARLAGSGTTGAGTGGAQGGATGAGTAGPAPTTEVETTKAHHHRKGGAAPAAPPAPVQPAPVLAGKAGVGVSASSSTTSIDIGRNETPEVTRVASGSGSPTHDEQKISTLPTINKEKRRKSRSKAGPQQVDSDRRRDYDNASVGGVLSDTDDPDSGGDPATVLPPIGGVKAKHDSKQAASKTLLTLNNARSTQNNSKGFGAGASVLASTGHTSMSSTGAMSSNHHWAGGAREQETSRLAVVNAAAEGTASLSGTGGAAQQMSSTWHASQRSNKYVSPFATKGHKKR